MKRTLIKDLRGAIGEEVAIAGWIDVRRDQGKMIFFDFRDRSGKVQGVVLPGSPAMTSAKELRNEWVVEARGKVHERPPKMVNEKEENGHIELEVLELSVLNPSEPMPFDVSGDTRGIDEEVRLRYRYLDLRSPRLTRTMKLRSAFIQKAREFLFKNDFTEIETPLLTESTPEGSRDFVVPSRIHPGKFYALPQSPQQYKQLLMTAGFERYFQVARAVRDEDLRADRGFEHTQIDIEMSFVEQEDVLRTVEQLITETVESLGFTIKEKPFPRFTYQRAMELFGADKFDLRSEEDKEKGILAYAWVLDFPFFEKTAEGQWTFSHNPFSMPKPEHLEWLMQGENVGEILTTQYDLVCNGFESGGGSIRAHKPEILEAVYRIMGFSQDETKERVGHILEAFRYGTPPHGGIALGVERSIMNLAGETQLREVQAFPMTRGGQTAVMKAPKPLTPEQLAELHLGIRKKDA